jgi:hypothetical protein
VWPFAGWSPPPGVSVIAEAYPALASAAFPREGRSGDQHDAYSLARWMEETDAAGALAGFFEPPLEANERAEAQVEGWILGLR